MNNEPQLTSSQVIDARSPYAMGPVYYRSWASLIEDINIAVLNNDDSDDPIRTASEAIEWMQSNEWVYIIMDISTVDEHAEIYEGYATSTMNEDEELEDALHAITEAQRHLQLAFELIESATRKTDADSIASIYTLPHIAQLISDDNDYGAWSGSLDRITRILSGTEE